MIPGCLGRLRIFKYFASGTYGALATCQKKVGISLEENVPKEIKYEIGNWDLPLSLEKGSLLDWNSSSIVVIEILAIELGHTTSTAKLLVKLI